MFLEQILTTSRRVLGANKRPQHVLLEPREAKKQPGNLRWRLLGAILAKDDFEGKTNKLAQAFDKK